MIRITFLIALLQLSIFHSSSAQTTTLRESIQQIISGKKATVGISISDNNGKDTLSINGDRHFPLQSVFKFPIALAVLSQVDKGQLSLAQKITIDKKDLLPGLYSPIRDKYPNGVTLPLSTILEYTVSQSDNVGCDILLKLMGGPQVVEDYLHRNGCSNISIKINEATQQANWDMQFQNWITPKEANELLEKFYVNKGKLLSKKSYGFIWKVMKETTTGEHRLRGGLPKGTIIMHKTGSSGTNKAGLTAAVNDIGVVFLPNGKYFYISVFVTESHENEATNEKIIAEVGRAVWAYYSNVQ